MIELPNEILLYHGSYMEVSAIDLSKCSDGLDFGKGFYLTTSFEQALNYVPAAVKKNKRRKRLPEDFDVKNGRVSVYRFHADSELLIHIFQTADVGWLHYVASNRNDLLFTDFRKKLEPCDIIGGKIADDDTSATLNAYISGGFGIPGTERVDSFTIGSLLPDRLKDQFCFRTEHSLKALEFIRSERYGDYR